MRREFLLSLLLLVGLGADSFAVQGGLQAVVIVRAEQKTRDRVIYYVVNTPLYREEPYFEVEVRSDKTDFVGEYEPRNRDEDLPAAWQPGAVVLARLRGHSLFLRRPNGTELRFVIVKRKTIRN